MKDQNNWASPSIFSPVYDNHGIPKSVHGSYWYEDAELRFSLNRQHSGAYLYRGELHLVDPRYGKTLELTGTLKKEALAKREKNLRKRYAAKETPSGLPLEDYIAQELSQPVYARDTLYLDSADEDAMRAYIEDRAIRLYAECATLIARRLGQSVTCDKITPNQALIVYGNDFFELKNQNAAAEADADKMKRARSRFINGMKEYFSRMPNKPMAEYTERQMARFLRDEEKRRGKPITKAMLQRLRDFWSFCLENGFCSGGNPFPPHVKRKRTAKLNQTRADTPEVLSVEVQDRLAALLLEQADGCDCAVALQTSGFAVRDIHTFKWSDVRFDAEREDFVIIRFLQPNKAGALHDYSRPCIPQCAMVLRAAYDKLGSCYSKTALAKMSIAGTLSDPAKAMSRDEIVKYTRKMLLAVGVADDTRQRIKKAHKGESRVAISSRILAATYENNLHTRCGISADEGTVKFLLGRSVTGDVTSGNYTSFTSPEAAERLYTILRVLRPVEDIEPPVSPALLDDGGERYIAAPANTAQMAGAAFTVVLQPGERCSIAAPHGAHIFVEPRGLNPDGTVRRKSPTRTKRSEQPNCSDRRGNP